MQRRKRSNEVPLIVLPPITFVLPAHLLPLVHRDFVRTPDQSFFRHGGPHSILVECFGVGDSGVGQTRESAPPAESLGRSSSPFDLGRLLNLVPNHGGLLLAAVLH